MTGRALHIVAAVLLVTAWVGLSGCQPACPATWVDRRTLVDEYNHNASRIPRLWARVRMSLHTRTEQGLPVSWGSTRPLAAPNGLLLLVKGPQPTGPHDFLLLGRETGGVELFRLGVSLVDLGYYFRYEFGDRRGLYYGSLDLAGAGRPEIPINPLDLLSVLCAAELSGDFTDLPVGVLTFSRDPCAYVLTIIDRDPLSDEIRGRREMYFRWDEQAPRRCFRVNLLDRDGRVIMTAELDDYRSVETEAMPRVVGRSAPTGPMLPTDIRISWPQQDSRIHLVLSEMTTTKPTSRAAFPFRRRYGADRGAGINLDDPIRTERPMR